MKCGTRLRLVKRSRKAFSKEKGAVVQLCGGMSTGIRMQD
jgi:hypothetical protein